jgi:hypothetical protein
LKASRKRAVALNEACPYAKVGTPRCVLAAQHKALTEALDYMIVRYYNKATPAPEHIALTLKTRCSVLAATRAPAVSSSTRTKPATPRVPTSQAARKERATTAAYVPLWERGPQAGSHWHKPKSITPEGAAQSAETRHVRDRNLGGDVYFVSGRLTRFARQTSCTLEQWSMWAQGAEELKI